MRCATLHRKLGTHISKVKSLSMDKWDHAQVDVIILTALEGGCTDRFQNMKRIGNVESNKAYNPRNVKPQIPIDVDEVDGALERYIRQKYQERAFLTDSRPSTRQNTGSTSSDDRPPPLPPKPTRRFGFGLQKSSTSSRDSTPPISPAVGSFGQDTSPPRVSKPSRVFGSNVNTAGDLDSKLAALREMGFPDEKRNVTVLKGVNGNLDRAVEALIRLGEQGPAKSRGTTPTPQAKPAPTQNGLSFDNPTTTSSMNPFDALDTLAPAPAPQQQQQQPISVQAHNTAYGTMPPQPTSPTNPFHPFLTQQLAAQQPGKPQSQPFLAHPNPYGQHHPLETSLQNLQISNQEQQQLFPNRTGGYLQSQSSPYAQTNPFQQTFTPPPMPQVTRQYGSFFPPQPTQYPSSASPTGNGNPFLKSVKSQIFAPSSSSNPFGQAQTLQTGQIQNPPQQPANPYGQAQASLQTGQLQNPPQQTANPFGQAHAFYQTQQQQQPSSFTQMQSQTPTQQQPAPNPFLVQPQQTAVPWQNSQAYQPTQQPGPSPFNNKDSILALYNYPHLAPQRPEAAQPALTPAPNGASTPTAPASGSSNPFAATAKTAASAPKPGLGHMSHESVDFAGLMGGRHSPDAFSGLSASFRR
ncbi:hypothetical protein M011DRAFT_284387 [Sporormia fimetaria CBS 119925]|uniref:UBA domain-containing protein n=1 Tax=Sporormia fimetaria CBS 119925 TaxID=1340428 RepID=A0A6A6VH97_9PLEO|nr:hypothetical protein M011DRAFT_284387 [Sporormia fimetaria CBS 119925]